MNTPKSGLSRRDRPWNANTTGGGRISAQGTTCDTGVALRGSRRWYSAQEGAAVPGEPGGPKAYDEALEDELRRLRD